MIIMQEQKPDMYSGNLRSENTDVNLVYRSMLNITLKTLKQTKQNYQTQKKKNRKRIVFCG